MATQTLSLVSASGEVTTTGTVLAGNRYSYSVSKTQTYNLSASLTDFSSLYSVMCNGVRLNSSYQEIGTATVSNIVGGMASQATATVEAQISGTTLSIRSSAFWIGAASSSSGYFNSASFDFTCYYNIDLFFPDVTAIEIPESFDYYPVLYIHSGGSEDMSEDNLLWYDPLYTVNNISYDGSYVSSGAGISQITELVIPPVSPYGYAVHGIDESGFMDYTNLVAVTIPSTVAIVGDEAFSGCTNLTSITFTGTVTQWNAVIKCSGWHYNVPATQVQCADGTGSLDPSPLNTPVLIYEYWNDNDNYKLEVEINNTNTVDVTCYFTFYDKDDSIYGSDLFTISANSSIFRCITLNSSFGESYDTDCRIELQFTSPGWADSDKLIYWMD